MTREEPAFRVCFLFFCSFSSYIAKESLCNAVHGMLRSVWAQGMQTNRIPNNQVSERRSRGGLIKQQ